MVVRFKPFIRHILALMFLLMLTVLSAQSIRVSASVDKTTLARHDLLHYTISVTSDRSVEFREPVLPGIDGLAFRNMMSSTSRSTSMINNQVTHQVRYDFTYILLPTRTGSVTIPSVSVSIGNRSYNTNTISVIIIEATTPAPQTPPPADPFDFWSFDWGHPVNGLSFIAPETAKRRIWLNEPVVVSYYLYTNQHISTLDMREEKDFPGYGKAEYEQPQALNYQYVDYGGKTLRRALLKRIAIIPNVTGTIKVPQLVCSARISTLAAGALNLVSRDLTLEVMPLPEANRPLNFSGAVGSFKVIEHIGDAQLTLGDALNYSIQIQGRGNFNQLSPPGIPATPSFRIADPIISGNIKAGIDGIRTYFYTLIPQDKGELTFEGAEFNWFDTDTGVYRTWRGEDHQISVMPGNVFSAFTDVFQPDDALRLYPAKPLNDYHPFPLILHGIYYWLVFALLMISLIVSYFIASGRNLRYRDPELFADLSAERNLRKYLREANTAAQNKQSEFYPFAEKGLIRYLAEKHQIPNHLSTDDRMAVLAQKGIPDDVVNQVRDFLLRCQTVRYMPGAFEQSDLQIDLSSLKTLISALSRLQMTRRIWRISSRSFTRGAIFLCLMSLLSISTLISQTAPDNRGANPAITTEINMDEHEAQDELNRLLELERSGISHPDLYFNIGVQYSERQESPLATLYYLRALNLDSSHRHARQNLKYTIATGSNRDQYPRHSFLAALFLSGYNYLNLNRLALLCLIIFALLVLNLHWLMHLSPDKERGLPILITLVTLLLLLGFTAMLGFKYNRFVNNRKVVIIASTADGYNSPQPDADKIFTLTAGLIAEVKQYDSDWALILLPDGGSGWIKSEDLLRVQTSD